MIPSPLGIPLAQPLMEVSGQGQRERTWLGPGGSNLSSRGYRSGEHWVEEWHAISHYRGVCRPAGAAT